MTRSYRTPKGTELPLMNLRGREYLEVKYRLVWFREERPDWTIETEYVTTGPDFAFAKATIKDQTGRIVATSHKFEDKKGFADFLEKAETGAVGRALALIGYGTQFAAEELDEGTRIVDSPVEPKSEETPKQETVEQDGSNFVIPFGTKYKGMTIAQAVDRDGLPSLQRYVGWLEDQASKKNQPLSGEAQFLKVNLNRFETSQRRNAKGLNGPSDDWKNEGFGA